MVDVGLYPSLEIVGALDVGVDRCVFDDDGHVLFDARGGGAGFHECPAISGAPIDEVGAPARRPACRRRRRR
jgi:hypothetical protein